MLAENPIFRLLGYQPQLPDYEQAAERAVVLGQMIDIAGSC
jgi:hypothetical protein